MHLHDGGTTKHSGTKKLQSSPLATSSSSFNKVKIWDGTSSNTVITLTKKSEQMQLTTAVLLSNPVLSLSVQLNNLPVAQYLCTRNSADTSSLYQFLKCADTNLFSWNARGNCTTLWVDAGSFCLTWVVSDSRCQKSKAIEFKKMLCNLDQVMRLHAQGKFRKPSRTLSEVKSIVKKQNFDTVWRLPNLGYCDANRPDARRQVACSCNVSKEWHQGEKWKEQRHRHSHRPVNDTSTWAYFLNIKKWIHLKALETKISSLRLYGDPQTELDLHVRFLNGLHRRLAKWT